MGFYKLPAYYGPIEKILPLDTTNLRDINYLQNQIDNRIRTQVAQTLHNVKTNNAPTEETDQSKIRNLTIDDFLHDARIYQPDTSYIGKIYNDNCHHVLVQQSRVYRRALQPKNATQQSSNASKKSSKSTLEATSMAETQSEQPSRDAESVSLQSSRLYSREKSKLLLTPTKDRTVDERATRSPFKTPEHPRSISKKPRSFTSFKDSTLKLIKAIEGGITKYKLDPNINHDSSPTQDPIMSNSLKRKAEEAKAVVTEMFSPGKAQRKFTRIMESGIKYETYSIGSDQLLETDRAFLTPMSPMTKRNPTPNTASPGRENQRPEAVVQSSASKAATPGSVGKSVGPMRKLPMNKHMMQHNAVSLQRRGSIQNISSVSKKLTYLAPGRQRSNSQPRVLTMKELKRTNSSSCDRATPSLARGTSPQQPPLFSDAHKLVRRNSSADHKIRKAS